MRARSRGSIGEWDGCDRRGEQCGGDRPCDDCRARGRVMVMVVVMAQPQRQQRPKIEMLHSERVGDARGTRIDELE